MSKCDASRSRYGMDTVNIFPLKRRRYAIPRIQRSRMSTFDDGRDATPTELPGTGIRVNPFTLILLFSA